MKTLITTLNSKFIHSSLSIRYLKNFCDKDIKDIEIEEYTINQSGEYIAGEIFKQKPDVVAFSCYIWNIENTLEIAERLKMVEPNLTIILGGPEVSFDGVEIMKLNDYIDFIVYGEGEETLKELLSNIIKEEKSYKRINGLIYRIGEEVFQNPVRLPISNLDDIPTPFTGSFEEYRNKIVYYESSRGCPFNCQFCLSSTIKGVRFFSIERVKKDLKKLIQAEVKQVKFVDRTFNARKDYAMEIMNFIISQNVSHTNFHFEVTAHLLDDEMLEFLSTVPEGLFQFEVGVQSTNIKTLESIDRKTDLEKLRKVITKINKSNNIHQHLDLIAGLPFEDYNSFKESFNDVYTMGPEKLQLGFLKLLKGSGLRKEKDKHGFKFINKPPYEVLENNYISYNEMLRIKIIEDLVEKYGNEGNFHHTIEFLIQNHFNTAFDFYENLSLYWERRSHHTRSHSKTELYRIMIEFYKEKISTNVAVFKEILRCDYIFNNKNPNIPVEIISELESLDKNLKHDFLQHEENILRYAPQYSGIPAKKIINNVHFERFSIDIYSVIDGKYNIEHIKNTQVIALFVYDETKKVFDKCKMFDVSRELLGNRE